MSCNPVYPDESIQMMGVVLCGGNSTRMGKDKGLLVQEETPWSEWAAQKLEQLGLPFCISINGKQQESYSHYFTSERLVVDSFDVPGPLRGIFSVHNQFPYHDLFVIACDLPDITIELMQKLMDVFRSNEGSHDFFVYQHEDVLEPLLGIYTREGLQKLTGLHALGQLDKFSMKHVLEISNTYAEPLSANELAQLRNYNTL